MDETAPHPTGPPDVRVPSESLRLLARSGDRPATGALREAGRRAGEAIADELAPRCEPEEVPMAEYWATVREALARRGFGDAEYRVLGPGAAEIRIAGAPEARPHRDGGAGGAEADAGGCPFATGLLAGLLSRVAGSPVAVLEVACLGRGEETCRFLAGAEERLRSVRSEILAGATVEEAVDAS